MGAATRTSLDQHRKELGAVLRRYRTSSGLTSEQLAERLNVSQPTVSRIETGRVSPRPNDVRRMASELGVPALELEDLVSRAEYIADLAINLRQAGDRVSVEGFQRRHEEAEALYSTFREFGMGVLPGLLQTPDYARALIQAAAPRIEPSALSLGVLARVRRQEILNDTTREFRFLLDPELLRVRFGSYAEHLAQIAHLSAVAARANVSLRILNLDHRLAAPLMHGFTIYGDSRVVVELHHSEIYVADPSDIRNYVELYEKLEACSHSDEDSAAILAAVGDRPTR